MSVHFFGIKTIFWHNRENYMALPSPKVGDIAGPRRFKIGERNLEAFGRTGITIKTWEIVSTRNKVPKIEIDFITNLI